MDYAGPWLGKMFVIIVDANSKWLDVHVMDTSTSWHGETACDFANQGLPEVLVSDNAPCFVSDEFESFLSRNGIKHLTSPAYHPSSNGLSSNGLTKRAVQTFKEGMKKLHGDSIQTPVAVLVSVQDNSTDGYRLFASRTLK